MAKAVQDWAAEERPADQGRRRFLTATLLAGGAGLVGTMIVGAVSVIPPPFVFRGTIEETFRTQRGGVVRLSDFQLWDGIAAVWRQAFDDSGEVIPLTGYPALLIAVERRLLQVPSDEVFEGRTMADFVISAQLPRRDTGELVDAAIVGIYNRCVHFCCRPSWHQEPVAEGFRAEWPNIALPRTLEAEVGPQDPIQCLCHYSMYDPVTLVRNVHPPPKAVPYIGARHVHGPATRALPCIPLRAAGETLVGLYNPEEGGHPEWYSAYCR